MPAFVALSCVGFIASGMMSPALAQDSTELEGATVTDTAIDGDVKVERLESPKYNQPLLDIPQTITVLTGQTLQQQNLLSLRDALSTIPGITFGAGEGGGGVGDSFNLRGFSALTDVTIDGVRDSAQYNRSDTFNIEQIEVINGANSVFGGSGSIGGTINLATKRPKATDQIVAQGGVGTSDYWRGTIDANVRSGNIAARLNVMGHKNDLAGRDFEYAKRWGIAPSITIGIEKPTRLTLQYLYQRDRNIPVYGVPYYQNALYDGLLPGEDYSGYYGYKNVDRQRQSINQATVIFEHDFSDKLMLRNLSRWQKVNYDTYVNPPQGSFCLANGQNPTGSACTTGQVPGTFYPSGPRGTARLTETSIWYNQLDLRASFEVAGMENTLTVGGSVSQEDYHIRNGNVLRNPNGATPNPTLNPISISDPDAIYTGPINFIQSGYSDGDTFNKAIYLFDTLNVTPQIELTGAVRYEGQNTVFRGDTIGATPANFGQYTRGVEQVSDDNLFSYRVGAVYKPVPNASLYVAYGNSRTPVSSGVRSNCGTSIANIDGATIDPCSASPQKAVNYEIGGKVDLFDTALQLTAAVFRNERTNYPVASNDPLLGTVQVNDGQSRVDGVSLGATGRITSRWTIFANYTYLDSKVKQSVSNYCLANPSTSYTPPNATAAVSCPAGDAQAGNPLTATPKHSGSLFTTYTLPFGLQLGYGFTYTGSFWLNNAAAPHYKSDDWMTHRAMVAFPFTDNLTGQVNIQNIFDKKYFTGIRNNGWAVPGEGRSAIFSIILSY
jgi:catecholate siderophore receptor